MLLHDILAGKSCSSLLGGCRVLVVEDEYVLAEDLREQLLSCGAKVMGPAATVADALALLETGLAPFGAILDIGLGGEMVYPVADALRARGIPFIFVTGYDACTIPNAYADVLVTMKPVAWGSAPLAHIAKPG